MVILMGECERCGDTETEENPLFEMGIQLTEEYWMLCDPCIDSFEEWIENTGKEDYE